MGSGSGYYSPVWGPRDPKQVTQFPYLCKWRWHPPPLLVGYTVELSILRKLSSFAVPMQGAVQLWALSPVAVRARAVLGHLEQLLGWRF